MKGLLRYYFLHWCMDRMSRSPLATIYFRSRSGGLHKAVSF
jgi:hypothetical protein